MTTTVTSLGTPRPPSAAAATAHVPFPRTLAQRDRARFARYRELLDFFEGRRAAPSGSRRERMLQFNYARAFVEKGAAYLVSDHRPVATATEETSEGRRRAAEAEQALRELWEANELLRLDLDGELDTAVLGDGAYKSRGRARAARRRLRARRAGPPRMEPRRRRAGGILLGKTNTPELTFAGETDNLVYGRTNNPFDLSRAPGGSSGGAGAIVCCGGAAFDIGSDTGGSVRGPAHYCGITGIKPNSGRVPRTGHIVPHGLGALDSLTQNGPMARYVEDLALIMPIISGPDWSDPFIMPVPLGDPADVDINGLRVCFYTDNGVRTPTAEIMATVRGAAAALDDVCASVEEDLPRAIPENPGISDMLRQGDGQAGAHRMLAKYGTTETHEWMTRQLQKSSESILPVGEYTAVLEQVDAYRSAMLGFMQNYDVIICPVSSFAALPHGESMMDKNRAGMNYTATYNITGWPSTVVRGGTSPDGLPIGVQVVARPWREDVSLAVAQYLEGALGGWQKPPM